MRSFVDCNLITAFVSIMVATASLSPAQTVAVQSFRFYTRGTAFAEATASCVPPGNVTTACEPTGDQSFNYLQLDPQSAGAWAVALAQCQSRCDACSSGETHAGASVTSFSPYYDFSPVDAPSWSWQGEFELDADTVLSADPNDPCAPGNARAEGEGETELVLVLAVSERTGLTIVWDLYVGTNGRGDHRAFGSLEVSGPQGAMIAVEFEERGGTNGQSSSDRFVLDPGVYELKYQAQVQVAAEGKPNAEARCRLDLELTFEKYACPEIYRQPRGVKSCVARPILLAPIINVGTFPEYQWRKGGVPLRDGPTSHGSVVQGTRERGLRISHTGSADSGNYDCVVSNLCGLVVTPPARVEIANCFGDLNCSGSIGVDDLALLLANFGTYPPDGFERGDLNEDGTVNLGDISILMNEFGRECD